MVDISSVGILSMMAIGLLLGLRFKIFVLVPSIGIILVVGAGMGIGQGDRPVLVVLLTCLTITALQVGYVAGAIVYFGTKARLTKIRRAS